MTDQNQAAKIVPNFDNTVESVAMKFRFKKDKLDSQRPTVEISALVPSLEGIVAILESGDAKQQELLKEAMYNVIRGAVAADVAEDETFSQDTFDKDFSKKYSWGAIANQDRADRRATSITAESWAAFAADYVEIMPAVANKKKEAVELAAGVFVKKFSSVKTNKEILAVLKNQLALYVEHTKKGEEFSEIIEVLTKKLDTYMKADDPALLLQGL